MTSTTFLKWTPSTKCTAPKSRVLDGTKGNNGGLTRRGVGLLPLF